jgi:hypothetical protein
MDHHFLPVGMIPGVGLQTVNAPSTMNQQIYPNMMGQTSIPAETDSSLGTIYNLVMELNSPEKRETALLELR